MTVFPVRSPSDRVALYLRDHHVLRDRGGRVSDIQDLLRGGHALCVSAMTIGEIYAGIRPEEERKVEMFLLEMERYDVTERLARHAGLLRNQWRRRGRTLELADMMIAATALEHGLALMTDNRKDFPMPELRFYPE